MIDQLRAELARDGLAAVTRQKLRNLLTVLEHDSQAHLESLTMVDPGPHAVVSFGDIRSADLVVFLLHGIDTDLGLFPAWADAAQRLCADVIRSCVSRGEPRRVAVIAWFGWDSGTHVSALATRHATVGAARLAIDIDRVHARNAHARLVPVTYSYSSTLLGELFALDLAENVNTAFSIASAGVTHAAGVALAEAIAEGRLVLYATEGANDSIAPLGRLGQHPVDPRDIPGVIVYECDGGEAPAVDGGITIGRAAEGHASQTVVDEHGRHTGYYDENAQGYLTLVARLAEAAVAAL
ncbi:alpha/beta hydrolase [Microbacterium sp. ARD32]|uniref:alpha/beta hydrolase n=1 Tax=Microbacterium sp. ARD32 TaxID=2962577 RepID=UPI002880CDE2|nr:alpha/beta hydrolase [Microbacterium sp. ARD32]MDT0156258.1 alpha/beta hydrolase [Microbacterium sp. ARD32]